MAQWAIDGQEFQVGNVVRVMRQVEDFDPNGMGEGFAWDNTWVGFDSDSSAATAEGMNKYLGMTFVIADISLEGVEFEGASNLSFLFPLSSLQYVAASQQEAA